MPGVIGDGAPSSCLPTGDIDGVVAAVEAEPALTDENKEFAEPSEGIAAGRVVACADGLEASNIAVSDTESAGSCASAIEGECVAISFAGRTIYPVWIFLETVLVMPLPPDPSREGCGLIAIAEAPEGIAALPDETLSLFSRAETGTLPVLTLPLRLALVRED